jgi:inositol 1,4,5-triphosphate receptor type 1
MNYSSLGKTFFLGLVVIYLFSVFGFLSLKNYYVEGDNGFNYADKLYLAFTSTINNGLRAGGGIGDSLTQVTRKTDDYWKMWFF